MFGQYSFSATVGLWLRYGVDPSVRSSISPFISDDAFTFTPEEYLELREKIGQLRRKFDRWPHSSSNLSNLHTGFFRHRELAESQQIITDHLERYLREGQELHRQLLIAINGSARRAYFLRRSEIEEAHARLRAADDELGRINALGRWKQRSALKALSTALNALRQTLGGLSDSSPLSKSHAPADLAKKITQLRNLLGQEREMLGRTLHERTVNLSPATAPPEERATLEELTKGLARFTGGINESGLYQLPLAATAAATTTRQLSILERVLEQLRTTRRHLDELPGLHQRQRSWYQQPARLRRLIGPLLELPPEGWEPAFSSWYFEACLRRSPAATPPSALEKAPTRLAPEENPADAARFFNEPYYCAGAPDWAVTPTAEPPPRLVIDARPGELKVYLPDRFDSEDAATLQDRWPTMFDGVAKLRLHHATTDAKITEALLRDGLTAGFLAAVLIRAAEAARAQPYDPEELAGIGRELYKRRSVPVPDPHPLMLELARLLRKRLPDHTFDAHRPWRATFLPLLVSHGKSGKRVVLYPEGEALPPATFSTLAVSAYGIWEDPNASLEAISADLLSLAHPS